MPPSNPDPQPILRPTMRRKSSAQNLLSSFKPGGSVASSSNNNLNNPAVGVIAPGSNSSSNGNNNSTATNGTHITPLLPPHMLSGPLAPSPQPQPPPSSYIPPPNAGSAPSSVLPTPTASGASTPALSHFSALHQHQQSNPAAAAAFVALGGPASVAAVAATVREWDAQSLQADSTGQFPPPVVGAVPGGGSPGATVEYLRDLVQKRIITLTYMRNVHDGCAPFLRPISMFF